VQQACCRTPQQGLVPTALAELDNPAPKLMSAYVPGVLTTAARRNFPAPVASVALQRWPGSTASPDT